MPRTGPSSRCSACLALTTELRSVKMELMVNRIAHRLYLKEETLWNRLRELHAGRQQDSRPQGPETIRAKAETDRHEPAPAAEPSVPAPFEADLLKILLAEPALVARASMELASSQIEHPGVRKIVEGLYRLLAEELTPDLDSLRGRLDDTLLDRACIISRWAWTWPTAPGVWKRCWRDFANERKYARARN